MDTFPRILILHDYFLYKGGGERLIITLAKHLKADVATAFIAKDAFNPRDYGIRTIELLRETFFSRLPGFRYLQVQFAFLLRTGFIRNYDAVIHSGDTLVAMLRSKKIKRETSPPTLSSAEERGSRFPSFAKEGTVGRSRSPIHIAYLHTPPRHLYDTYRDRLQKYGIIKKSLFIPFVVFNRWRFGKLAHRLNLIVTNSHNTQTRIKQYLGLESTVVYPPCTTLPFKNISQGDYFFSWGRLYDIKRVYLIVEAFTKMPNKKLVVASGGPELERIKQIAAGHPNITILGWISDDELLQYLGNCLATIYIPIREDFGMTAVESMAAGKPVIGVAEGGLLEIIEDGENGLMLKPDFTIDDLVSAVKRLTPELARPMELACLATAQKFTEERFREGMKQAIDTVLL